jgi:hypothetical protein
MSIRRDSCSWDLDRVGRVVIPHSTQLKAQVFSSRTLKDVLS